ncbi:MAG TPA: hypothetical protein ENI02_01165 [Candidatus Aminicenantes bacterium]|nr:hypothetical protein [Candidatus Aminicenantes bacterium]
MEKITKDIILDYQTYLTHYRTKGNEPLSNKTQNLKLNALRKFFVFLIKKDLILKDPTTVLAFQKEEQRLTRNILSEKEVFKLLENLKPREPIGIRNRAIIELFYACGIRTSELCTLKVQDVDLKEQTVTIVKGKGNKSRVVPIGQYATYYIELYLKKARKHMLKGKKADLGYLFLSQRGNPFNRTTINKCVIGSILRKGLIEKSISCYSMRHSIATHLLRNRVDIMYIALQSFSEMIKLKYEGERVDFELTGERVEFKSRDLFEVMTGSRFEE